MAFVFLCAYLIFLFLRPQDWLVTGIAPLRPVLIMQILAVTSTAFELGSGRLQMPSSKQPWWLIMTGLFLGILLSNLRHFDIPKVTDSFSAFGKTYLTFILLWVNLNSMKRIKIFSFILIAVAVTISVHCILIMKTGSGFGSGGSVSRRIGEAGSAGEYFIHQAQFYGIFNDPNDTSQILVSVMPLCFFFAIVSRGVLFKILFLSIIIPLALGVIATESRGGFISMAATIFVALRGFFHPTKFIIISVVAGGLLFGVAPARMTGGMSDDSSSSRIDFWGEATVYFKMYPLFGTGFQTNYEMLHHATHNSYVQAYSELGVFGYTFWFLAVIFAMYSMLRLSKALPENDEEKSLVFWMQCVISSLVGYYAAGFFLSRAYVLPLYVMFAMTAACYSISSQKVGITAVNHHCHMYKKHWVKWASIPFFNIIFIIISITVLNKIM